LDEEIQVEGAVNDARVKRIGQGGGRTARAAETAQRAAKSFRVLTLSMNQNRVVEIIRSKNLAAIRRPTDPEFIQEITGDFHDARLDQNLRGWSVHFLDQLEHLREEVDVGRDEQRIAALVGHDAHPSNQIAHRTRALTLGEARIVRLAPSQGKLPLLLGFLLKLEIVLGRAVLIVLLLLVVLVGLLSLWRDGPQRRRAIFSKEDV